MLLLRQIWTLTVKNILVVLLRHSRSTTYRAFVLPILFITFQSYARNLFIPPSAYGVGNATPVRSLASAISAAGAGRNTIAFVNNGLVGGDIDKVIQQVAGPVQSEGKTVQILSREDDLLTICPSSIRAVSNCYAAAVFFASPTEGPGGMWNYSIRADGALGSSIYTTNTHNDAEIYTLPLQHAIDFTIASLNTSIDQASLPSQVDEYPYTSQTQAQRSESIRIRFMNGIIEVLGVVFFIGMVGISYQLVGLMASEREIGITQLIDGMMPNTRRWEPQIVRIISTHLAFDIMYLPGWVGMALILSQGVFAKTSVAIVLFFYILAGLSLSSFSIFGGAFFKKAQLSGISSVIISLLLAIVAQISNKASTGPIAVLSLLFPPMTFTLFLTLMARWERQAEPTNLIKPAPQNPSTLPGIVFFIFFIIQIIAFPFLGALVEKLLYGTASKGRKVFVDEGDSRPAVELSAFTKQYPPNWFARSIGSRFRKPKESVIAVNNLSLTVRRGQILVLLGANGSGKSTTLDAIAGLNTITSGTIAVDGSGGLGLCPQKNVMWPDVTVEEHVNIFNRLKSTGTPASKVEVRELISACDLGSKLGAQSKTLSGGQKRKLALGMMFIGGSRVCCVDECSSGVDALARSKLWDILLAERGRRTIIFTTHFLDEADLLSDQIAILSRGVLKAEGSAVELKHRLGGGYRIHLYDSPGGPSPLEFPGITSKAIYGQTTYSVPDSAQAAWLITKLEQEGFKDYEIAGPTIEDCFFKVAEDTENESSGQQRIQDVSESHSPKVSGEAVIIQEKKASTKEYVDEGPQLRTGKRLGMILQAGALFRKRLTVLRRNPIPYCAAFLLPVIAGGLVTLFLKGYSGTGCSPTDQVAASDISSFSTQTTYQLVVGPSSRISTEVLSRLESTLPGGGPGAGGLSTLQSALHVVDTLDDFNDYINQNYANVTPGGFFLGENGSPVTFAWKGDADISVATITQNLLDSLLTNVSISSQYQSFDIPWTPSVGKTLQLIVYFGLAMCAYPAFFVLYPTAERLRNVRAVHYSNGVRSLPLWLAYASFDFLIALAASVIVIAIFVGASSAWYYPGYLFVVLFCYGLASILLSYVVSLFARSQLAAFAVVAGYQAVLFLLYFIAYLSVLTYSPTNKVDSYLEIVHFTISLISPAGSLIRGMFVGLNVFSILCRGHSIASYPGEITLYGGPILYLLVQSFLLFGFLIWWDESSIWAILRHRKYKAEDEEEADLQDDEIASEVKRVKASTDDGLQVLHLNKSYGKNVAVQDVTFGVKHGEVFGLLGPNGAGKSTLISLIRGDIRPSHNGGKMFIENKSINKQAARSQLGVCPQFDSIDQMTVLEHLRFYARIRGVDDVEHNVREVVRAVGLERFASRMAAKLSGGNRRKLSLGIALMGGPKVLLLDEPSSGMDVTSKRIMWRTLASVVPGRSLVLTTHSMEEADALANRVGIMAKKMLALGTSDYLRRKHGDRYHVHLITTTAPHTSSEEMDRIKIWVATNFEGAVVEQKTYHGQLRFSVPARSSITVQPRRTPSFDDNDIKRCDVVDIKGHDHSDEINGIGALFTTLETQKEELGFEYYSVSQTTLDQVFLSIVGKHHIEEENYAVLPKKKPVWKRALRRWFLVDVFERGA